MTRVIFFAVLACLFVGHVFGQCSDGMCSPEEAQLIQMDMEAANVDPSSKPETTETEPAPRQFLIGGYGGYSGFGGYGGYGGYGGFGGGYGGYGGGLSSGLCTRSCFGIRCRLICRNRVFFDEDPEEAQDSDDEMSEDEMNDLSMEDESDDTDAQDDHMVGSTKGDWLAKNPEKKLRSASCKNPSHSHSSSKSRIELTESSRPFTPSSKWSTEKHHREVIESSRPELSSNFNSENREISNSGLKVVVVPHKVFQTLRPSDILVREKYITNPDNSKTWTKFKTISGTSHSGSSNENVSPLDINKIDRFSSSSTTNENVRPSVISSNRLESTISHSGSSENANSAFEKHHSSKEESSRGNFFNPSSSMLDRFTSERNREEVRPSSLEESSRTETSSSRREELERQEKLERREEMLRRKDQRLLQEQQEKREEMRRREEQRREEQERLESESGRKDIKWTLGSSRREGLETSNLEASRLPTENFGGNTMSEKEWHMMMKKKHHKRHPIVIVMDEDQEQQQDEM